MSEPHVPPSEAFAVRCERTGDWYLAVDEDELSASMCLRDGCRCMGCTCDCRRVAIRVFASAAAPVQQQLVPVTFDEAIRPAQEQEETT